MRVRFEGGIVPLLMLGSACAAPSTWIHITINGRAVENSHYLEASFLYQLQTLVGTEAASPKVMDGVIVRREGKELYIDLEQLPGARFHWDYAQGYQDSYRGTSPVGKFFPNSYFLYDMAGNAREWTSSFYERYPDAPAGEKPYGPPLRVVKGSSWADGSTKTLRCASRTPTPPKAHSPFVGFS